MDGTKIMTSLSANSSIGAWLDHPLGGEVVRSLLAQTGGSEESLEPIRALPLQQLAVLSQGKMPQSVIDDLVLNVNGGEEPEQDLDPGWQEKIIDGRFIGKTVLVTGAASGIGRATASRVAREGGRVIAVDVSEEKLNELRLSLPETLIIGVAADITDQAAIDAVVRTAGKN